MANRVTLVLFIPGHMRYAIRTVEQLTDTLKRDYPHVVVEQIQIQDAHDPIETPAVSIGASDG